MASYPPGFAAHTNSMDALQYEYEDIMKTEERRNDFIQVTVVFASTPKANVRTEVDASHPVTE